MAEIGPNIETDSTDLGPGIRPHYFVWAGLALVATVVAIHLEDAWLLRSIHVLGGVLWTGSDIFLGFIVGPILRRIDFAARRAVIARLAPKTLIIMPTVAILTPTAGWSLATRFGMHDLSFPEYGWMLATLVITGVMVIQGLGIILPSNYRIYREMRKNVPDPDKLMTITRRFFYNIALQGLMQIAIILIMVKFSVGL